MKKIRSRRSNNSYSHIDINQTSPKKALSNHYIFSLFFRIGDGFIMKIKEWFNDTKANFRPLELEI